MEIKLNLSVLSLVGPRLGRVGETGHVVRLFAHAGAEELVVQAFGNLMFCAGVIPCTKTEEAIDTYLYLADLMQILKKSKDVTLRFSESGVEYREGKRKIKIRPVTSADFKQVPPFGFPEVPPTGIIETMSLVTAIIDSGAYSDAKSSFAGVMIEKDGEEVKAVGTDGTRFCIAHAKTAALVDRLFVPYQLAEAYKSVCTYDKNRWKPVNFGLTGDTEQGCVSFAFSSDDGATFAMGCPRSAAEVPSHARLLSMPSVGELVFDVKPLLAEVAAIAETKWSDGKAMSLEPDPEGVRIRLLSPDVDIETVCPLVGDLPAIPAKDWPKFTADHLHVSISSLDKLGVDKVRITLTQNSVYPSIVEPVTPLVNGFKSLLLPRRA